MSFPISVLKARAKAAAVVSLVGATGLLAACGGGDKTTGPPGGNQDVWATVAQRQWSMPSESEGYKCHAELVTSDEYFTGFRLASPPAAQTELYVLMRPSVQQVGDYDCDSGSILGGEAIYIAGPGTTQLEFTGGKGVHVASGQYLMFVVHVVNTTSSGVTASTKVEGRVAAAKDVTTPIDMFLGGRLDLLIPADGSAVVWNGSCVVQDEMHLVAVMPLMRALGVHESVANTVGSNAQTLFDESFDPQHVLYTTLTSDVDIPAGSRLTTSCTFVNNTGVVVNDGESASDEICFSGIYRYPPKPPTSMSPIECPLGYNL